MLVIFHRCIHGPDKDGLQKVTVRCVAMTDTDVVELGVLEFPNKMLWTRFVGSLQRGQTGMRDFDIKIENVKPTLQADKTEDPPPNILAGAPGAPPATKYPLPTHMTGDKND